MTYSFNNIIGNKNVEQLTHKELKTRNSEKKSVDIEK